MQCVVCIEATEKKNVQKCKMIYYQVVLGSEIFLYISTHFINFSFSLILYQKIIVLKKPTNEISH